MSNQIRIFTVLLITIFVGALSNHAQAQPKTAFTVIKVSGSIYSATLKRAVTSGDVLSPSDKLKFDSRSASIRKSTLTFEQCR